MEDKRVTAEQILAEIGIDVERMMQSTKNWLAYNLTIGLNEAMDRWVFLERHMRSAEVVIIIDVFVQRAVQMFFVENDNMIQTALETQRWARVFKVASFRIFL